MRTVFLPASNADALVLKIEAMQAQLNEQVRGRAAPLALQPAEGGGGGAESPHACCCTVPLTPCDPHPELQPKTRRLANQLITAPPSIRTAARPVRGAH